MFKIHQKSGSINIAIYKYRATQMNSASYWPISADNNYLALMESAGVKITTFEINIRRTHEIAVLEPYVINWLIVWVKKIDQLNKLIFMNMT
ncbi:hypothetical protein AO729_07295 [Pseudomonas sp. TTU2014-066ASC]|nr:hypothetical protein AO729_07295 [Pseudomonas sp. TTU2014-066ASC]